MGTPEGTEHAAAEAAREVSRATAGEALQPAHRGRVPALGASLHLLSRQAPSAGDGRVRGRGVPVASRDRGAGLTFDAEPGAGGPPFSLSRSPGKGAPVDGRHGAREAPGACAGGAHRERSAGAARPARRHALARFEPALRDRHAAARRASATRQGRRFRAPGNCGARRQGRARPAHDAARAPDRAAALASRAREGAA